MGLTLDSLYTYYIFNYYYILQVNLSELAKTLGLPEGQVGKKDGGGVGGSPQASRRKSMERMEMIKMTPDTKAWDNKDKEGK